MSENLREQVQINVSIIVEHLPGGSYLGFPEHAEHIRFISDERQEVISQVLLATADCLELDE